MCDEIGYEEYVWIYLHVVTMRVFHMTALVQRVHSSKSKQNFEWIKSTVHIAYS